MIKVENNKISIVGESNEEMGYMLYQIEEQTLHVSKTYTHEAYRGQGIANQLFKAISELAKEKGLMLTSSCSFVNRMLELTNEK